MFKKDSIIKGDSDQHIQCTLKILKSHHEMIRNIAYHERMKIRDVYGLLIEYGLKSIKRKYPSTYNDEVNLFD